LVNYNAVLPMAHAQSWLHMMLQSVLSFNPWHTSQYYKLLNNNTLGTTSHLLICLLCVNVASAHGCILDPSNKTEWTLTV